MDDKTRAIIIDFTVYNANINLFNQIRYETKILYLFNKIVFKLKLYYTIEQFLDVRLVSKFFLF